MYHGYKTNFMIGFMFFVALLLLAVAVFGCAGVQKAPNRSGYCFSYWTGEPECFASYPECRAEEVRLTEAAPWSIIDRSCKLRPAR